MDDEVEGLPGELRMASAVDGRSNFDAVSAAVTWNAVRYRWPSSHAVVRPSSSCSSESWAFAGGNEQVKLDQRRKVAGG